MHGRIVAWNTERGVGFIRPRNVGADGDLAITSATFIESGLGSPKIGDRFSFDLRVPPHSIKIEPFDFRPVLGDRIYVGTIKHWHVEQGYGFLRDEKRRRDLRQPGEFTRAGLCAPEKGERYYFKQKIAKPASSRLAILSSPARTSGCPGVLPDARRVVITKGGRIV